MSEVYAQCHSSQKVLIENRQTIAHLDTAYLQFEWQNQPLNIRFFDNAQGHHLTLNYQDGLLSLDRSASEQTEPMAQFGEIRYCRVERLEKVEIFFDRSVMEIFINDGEKVMTSRFFIANRENIIQVSQPLSLEIAQISAIEYK